MKTKKQTEIPTLAAVDAYQAPSLLIKRLIKEHDYSEANAQALFREAKRMLYLHALTRKPVSPSLDVDDAWHAMLMFTRTYRDFAKFIGVYVHHEPSEGPPDDGKLYRATKEAYAKTFGEPPDPKYWP